MRYIVIDQGVISNIVNSDSAIEANWYQSDDGDIGDLYDVETGIVTPVALVVVPVSVSMAQARKALILNGVSISSVDAAIASIEDATLRELAQVDWEYSVTVRRDNALLLSVGAALGLTELQIDNLFIGASQISE